MHRLMFWRLGFELKNIERIYHSNKETINYFAFGANLDPAVLLRRKIKPLSEKPFKLENFELQFTHPGAFEGMGFASIESAAGKTVYGKLYELSTLDAKRMDYYELVPVLNRYRRVLTTQQGQDFYFYQSCDPRSGLKPTKNYWNMIINGFEKASDIPPEFIEGLASTATLDKMIPAKDLNFLVNNIERWPDNIKTIMRSYDSTAIKIFLKYVKDKSLTEKMIHV